MSEKSRNNRIRRAKAKVTDEEILDLANERLPHLCLSKLEMGGYAVADFSGRDGTQQLKGASDTLEGALAIVRQYWK